MSFQCTIFHLLILLSYADLAVRLYGTYSDVYKGKPLRSENSSGRETFASTCCLLPSRINITMYCRALSILAILLGTISTNVKAANSEGTCYNATSQDQKLYLDILCSCPSVNQAAANPTERWTQADCDWALEVFNSQWLNNSKQTLPYVQALSAYWNGPESNVYPLPNCRPLELRNYRLELQRDGVSLFYGYWPMRRY